MKFAVTEEAKKELVEYCEKYKTNDLKALLRSEHGEEGAKIMYKYLPVMVRRFFNEEKFLQFFNKNKELILNNLPTK